jgi:hypothetical protein
VNLTRRRLLLPAGAVVIALTNAVALMDVAYNRKNHPDSVLTLTERELGAQRSWMWREGENSGLGLELQFRAEGVPNPSLPENEAWPTPSPYGVFGPVGWLDKDKLAALGFDVNMPPTMADSDRHYEHMLGRDVLLVLELDGPVHARVLQAARDRVARLEREEGGESENAGRSAQLGLQSARVALQREEYEWSRLFIIDAGLDQASLRQRYPDRSRYAIVHGAVRPFVLRVGAAAKIYGRVTAVRCLSIHVPLQFRGSVPVTGKQHSTVEVAFGRRLEPWILSARVGTP